MKHVAEKVLITGVAGFIGAALAERLLHDGHLVFGLDNLNDYYDIRLKHARLERVKEIGGDNVVYETIDIADGAAFSHFINTTQPTIVVHLAAQAGVRYSLQNPAAYAHSNLVGHLNVLESCRHYQHSSGGKLRHVLYASSSSVYGGNDEYPFTEDMNVNNPQSLYAASKLADEAMSNAYSHLFDLPQTGLRFFTVYGPWGRPDMSPMLFARAILEKKPITVYNHGDLWRDFTYVDDIIESIVKLLPVVPARSGNKPAHAIYNLGNSQPVRLLKFIEVLEDALGEKAILDLQPWPPTEVYKTAADTTKLFNAVGWKPKTELAAGLEEFAKWFREWHAKTG